MVELSNQEKDKRLWGMLCHLTALIAFVGIPLGNILGPLVIWLIKRNEIPAVDIEGKESLNFQISMTIYSIVAVLLCVVLIGFLLLIPLLLLNLILVIVASVKTNNGETFKYPLSIQFFR